MYILINANKLLFKRWLFLWELSQHVKTYLRLEGLGCLLCFCLVREVRFCEKPVTQLAHWLMERAQRHGRCYTGVFCRESSACFFSSYILWIWGFYKVIFRNLRSCCLFSAAYLNIKIFWYSEKYWNRVCILPYS